MLCLQLLTIKTADFRTLEPKPIAHRRLVLGSLVLEPKTSRARPGTPMDPHVAYVVDCAREAFVDSGGNPYEAMRRCPFRRGTDDRALFATVVDNECAEWLALP